jgi:hypothetical protein
MPSKNKKEDIVCIKPRTNIVCLKQMPAKAGIGTHAPNVFENEDVSSYQLFCF